MNNRCKNDTKTNCFKIISSHFCKKKRNAPPPIAEREKPCANGETSVEPTGLSANKVFINKTETYCSYVHITNYINIFEQIESTVRTDLVEKVEKTEHDCPVKQSRPLGRRPRTMKCRKRCKRASKNTVLSVILRRIFYWCPCFCRCKTKCRRISSPKICVNGCRRDEKLLKQLCFSCSDKGLNTSTENFKTITNTRQKSNNGSGKTKATWSEHQPENERRKIMFNDEIAIELINVESAEHRRDSRKSYETA